MLSVLLTITGYKVLYLKNIRVVSTTFEFREDIMWSTKLNWTKVRVSILILKNFQILKLFKDLKELLRLLHSPSFS